MNHQIVMLIVCGSVSGCLFKYFNIPGGCMLGAVVGSMAVKLLGLADVQMPSLFYNAAQLGIGICVGSMLSLDMLSLMKDQIPVMILSTFILLAAGLGAAFVVRHMTDIDVTGSILATSPGGTQRRDRTCRRQRESAEDHGLSDDASLHRHSHGAGVLLVHEVFLPQVGNRPDARRSSPGMGKACGPHQTMRTTGFFTAFDRISVGARRDAEDAWLADGNFLPQGASWADGTCRTGAS